MGILVQNDRPAAERARGAGTHVERPQFVPVCVDLERRCASAETAGAQGMPDCSHSTRHVRRRTTASQPPVSPVKLSERLKHEAPMLRHTNYKWDTERQPMLTQCPSRINFAPAPAPIRKSSTSPNVV